MAERRTIALAGMPPSEPLARGAVLFIGTATTVIRYGGFTVLTDPNFLHAGDHARRGCGLTAERLTNPALEIEDLPDLDACVLSHLHGDTLVHDGLDAIRRRYPDVPLSLLHLGGTRVLGVPLTMDAAQGVEALRIVRPRRVIPVHHDDYTVFRSSLDDFLHAVRAAGLTTEVHTLRRGERLEFGLGVALAEAAIPAS